MATSFLGQDLGACGRMMNRGKYFNKVRGHPRQFLGNQLLTSMMTSSLQCMKDPGLLQHLAFLFIIVLMYEH